MWIDNIFLSHSLSLCPLPPLSTGACHTIIQHTLPVCYFPPMFTDHVNVFCFVARLDKHPITIHPSMMRRTFTKSAQLAFVRHCTGLHVARAYTKLRKLSIRFRGLQVEQSETPPKCFSLKRCHFTQVNFFWNFFIWQNFGEVWNNNAWGFQAHRSGKLWDFHWSLWSELLKKLILIYSAQTVELHWWF